MEKIKCMFSYQETYMIKRKFSDIYFLRGEHRVVFQELTLLPLFRKSKEGTCQHHSLNAQPVLVLFTACCLCTKNNLDLVDFRIRALHRF